MNFFNVGQHLGVLFGAAVLATAGTATGAASHLLVLLVLQLLLLLVVVLLYDVMRLGVVMPGVLLQLLRKRHWRLLETRR